MGPASIESHYDEALSVPGVIEAIVRSERSEHPADAYVLAGAVLCGYEGALQTALGQPVFDGVRCAVRQVRGA